MPWQTTWLTEVQIGLRKTLVIQGRRDRLLDIHDEVVADPVDFPGGHAGPDPRPDHVQDVGREASGDAHGLPVRQGS